MPRAPFSEGKPMHRLSRLLALAALVAGPLAAQGVPVTFPNVTNSAGQPLSTDRAFILNADGTLANFSGIAGGGITRGALTDGSGTIATGGASQQVFAAAPTRSYLMCQNPTTATEPLFVNIGAAASTAAGSIELGPGGSFDFSHNFIPTGAVNVTAATLGHRFVCKAG
jgi:hypothetical protein